MELSDDEGRGTQGSHVRSELSDDKDMPADDEEVELSMIFDPDIQNQYLTVQSMAEQLMKEWTAPIYAFKPVPVIEYVDDCRCHIF